MNVTILDDQIVDLPIGLDGVPRMSELSGFGVLAMQGTWTAPDTFNIDLQVPGVPEQWTFLIRFVNNDMHVMLKERLSGYSTSVSGKGGT